MTHWRSVPASEYEEYSEDQKELTYVAWIKELRKEFKKQIDMEKEYSTLEKNQMIEEFISVRVKKSLRWYIWEDANYSYHIRTIKKSLHWCFDTVKKAQLRAEEKIRKILDMRERQKRLEKYRDFFIVGTSID